MRIPWNYVCVFVWIIVVKQQACWRMHWKSILCRHTTQTSVVGLSSVLLCLLCWYAGVPSTHSCLRDCPTYSCFISASHWYQIGDILYIIFSWRNSSVTEHLLWSVLHYYRKQFILGVSRCSLCCRCRGTIVCPCGSSHNSRLVSEITPYYILYPYIYPYQHIKKEHTDSVCDQRQVISYFCLV